MKRYLERAAICPHCEKRIGMLEIDKEEYSCPLCHNNINERWIGRPYFKTRTHNHRTTLKCLINPILRKIQFFTNYPFVISSICDFVCEKEGEQTYIFYYYRFQRVRYK